MLPAIFRLYVISRATGERTKVPGTFLASNWDGPTGTAERVRFLWPAHQYFLSCEPLESLPVRWGNSVCDFGAYRISMIVNDEDDRLPTYDYVVQMPAGDLRIVEPLDPRSPKEVPSQIIERAHR